MNLSQIAEQLSSEDTAARLEALAALENQTALSPLPFEVCSALLSCLGHSRKAVQRGAATQLARLALIQPEIIQSLTSKLADPDTRLRWTAAYTLSQLDLPEPTPLPILIENLGHDESDLRWAAATAILRLAAQHPSVLGAMLRLARAGNAVQRRMALYCLRDLAQTSTDARAVYLSGLNDPDPMVRLSALSCIGKLQVPAAKARETLLHMLEADPDLGVRRAAAVTLGQLGDHASVVVEALRKASRTGDVGLSKAAAGALNKLQRDTESF